MMDAKDKAVTGLTSGIEFLFKKNNVWRTEYNNYTKIPVGEVREGIW